MNRRFTRATASAAAVTALGAAAILAGLATHDPAPTPVPTLAADQVEYFTCPGCSRILSADLEDHIATQHPELWAQITGGGK